MFVFLLDLCYWCKRKSIWYLKTGAVSEINIYTINYPYELAPKEKAFYRKYPNLVHTLI